ncbi:unnamed protein product [Aphanomyces euteiches]|uniref:FYVE-type domain-containing protein n=1 Tax=Aphanomyces euteiches TaxID=100861 RepID=A0A6G0W593_9STRA|nr:hypothetical protein Ae201684_018508 [Aphanomyces euteiches]
MPAKVPLSADFFQCPPLSREAIQRFGDLGRQSAETLICKAKLRDGACDWKLHREESELKIYKEDSCTEIEGPPRYCGVMQVVGELDEYIDLFRYDTTDQARESFSVGGPFVDVMVLYTVHHRNPYRPNDSTRIKWFLAKSPMEGFVPRRDFVVLETDMEFKVDGKRAWVRSHRSVQLSAVPDLRRELNCVRGEMNDMGHVVVESDRSGYLDVTYVADMEVNGMAQFLAIDSALKSWLRSMTCIDRCMRENRLSRTPFLDPTQICALQTASTCSLCRQRIGSMRKKANCFKCGDVFCRTCCPSWKVRMDGQEVPMRACLPCSLNTSALSSWTQNSSISTVEPPAMPAIQTQTSNEWALLETNEDDSTIDDDDIFVIDVSASIDSNLVNPIILDPPSMRDDFDLLSTYKMSI